MNVRAKLSFLPTVFCLAALVLPAAARATDPWVPLGPDLINNGQAWPGRVPVTGRINVVVPNPLNPLGDVWVGAAGGGVWNGTVWPNNFWSPMTDDAASLAVGAIALDSCNATFCSTVWAGTGEDSIRRDTQYGSGILKGTWNFATNVYDWTQLGDTKFSRGAVTKLVLDPTTPDNGGKVLFAALSTGQTSNSTESTVTTNPVGHVGVWRSKDAGQTWAIVLDHKTPATDLEMDPMNHNVLFAGMRRDGLYRSLDGGSTWQAIGQGIPASLLTGSDWPEIAVFRNAKMTAATVYAVLGSCPHPHEKGPVFWCSPAIFRSLDEGSTWTQMHAAVSPAPAYGEPLTAYTSYTHALTIHPTNPNILWFGGINLYKSTDAGVTWNKIGNTALHPDHHQVAAFATNKTPSGLVTYDVNDGGLFVGDGQDQWSGGFQQGLAVTQFQSVSTTAKDTFLFGGTQDNGTNVYQGTEVWEHADDGDSASTLIDLDDENVLYDVYVGTEPRRCKGPGFCPFGWPDITWGLPQDANVSWYPPLAQSVTAAGGVHPLYIGTTQLFQTSTQGDSWSQVPADPSLPWPLGGTGTIAALNNIQNPITAVAVAPNNPNRIYVGFYGGQVFTTANGQSALPQWTAAGSGLPGRPVTALAVHPANESTVLAAVSGFGSHSVYRTTTAGTVWGSLDDSNDGSFAIGPVDTLAIASSAPYGVWAGTDTGVYSRSDPDSSVALWFKSTGLPNVAVYGLAIVDGKTLYAGTHGRGVWRLSLLPQLYPIFNDVACCGVFDPYVPAPYVSVEVAGYDPVQKCTMSLFENGRLCSTSAVDADGGALATDAHGFLVSTKAGYYTNRKVTWACMGGACAGGVSWASCNVSEVEVDCGRGSVRSAVRTAQETKTPTSTQLGFAPQGREGSFTLTPTIKKNGGLSTALCSVAVSYAAGEDDSRVLARAASIINSDARCQAAGVQATVAGSAAAGSHEDLGPTPIRLSLSQAQPFGVQLITEVTGHGLAAFTVGSYGTPRTGSLVAPLVSLAGVAAGGRVEVTESSPLGTCTFGVDTLAGDAPETVAAGIQRAFLGRPDTSVFQLSGGCPARQNARDVNLNGAVLQFPLGQQVSVRSTDPGLSFTLGSER
ncbi:MAG TPA: hypothetical protein VIA62_05005 [Thermoanaerobaculia bacterium]|jgi:hypothetical protein|nr:hypothetical protein [Thermoanaerobaculia bacterium]